MTKIKESVLDRLAQDYFEKDDVLKPFSQGILYEAFSKLTDGDFIKKFFEEYVSNFQRFGEGTALDRPRYVKKALEEIARALANEGSLGWMSMENKDYQGIRANWFKAIPKLKNYCLI